MTPELYKFVCRVLGQPHPEDEAERPPEMTTGNDPPPEGPGGAVDLFLTLLDRHNPGPGPLGIRACLAELVREGRYGEALIRAVQYDGGMAMRDDQNESRVAPPAVAPPIIEPRPVPASDWRSET